MSTATETAWAERFATKLLALGTKAQRDLLVSLGRELYATRAASDPEGVAEEEFKAWPPHDD
jgi:hypothetical protein